MGLFDNLFGDKASDRHPLTEAEAFAGVLMAAAACDGHAGKQEVADLRAVLGRMKLFADLTDGRWRALADTLVRWLKRDGVLGLADRCAAGLPPELRELRVRQCLRPDPGRRGRRGRRAGLPRTPPAGARPRPGHGAEHRRGDDHQEQGLTHPRPLRSAGALRLHETPMKPLHSLLALLLVVPAARAENWPGWRGPTGMGQSAEKDPPLTWGPTENVRWKAPLPDRGNASPAVWGDHIFLTQATNKGAKRGVLCIDRKTGNQKWATYVDYAGKEPTHDTNPYGSATCATDGERVVASLGSAGLLCLDFDGKELWRKDLGEQIHIWGNASSPVIHGDHVIQWVGPGERQFLVALNKKTGDEAWRHEETSGDSGLKKGTSGSARGAPRSS